MNASDYPYLGPVAEVLDITGSPYWGLAIDDVIKHRLDRGWKLTFHGRVPTPYGVGPLVVQFTTPAGKKINWIPSYGGILKTNYSKQETQWMLFWLAWKMGAKVMTVGGTSGTNDWRGFSGEDSVRPHDIVFPWSYYPSPTMASHLPSTDIGGVLPYLALMKSPFCPTLTPWMARKVEEVGFFRRVHTPETVRAVLRSPSGGTFETEAETMIWRAMTRACSQESPTPVVMLHGDCVSPVLCRRLGIHELYFHVVANAANGHPDADRGLTDELDELYIHKLPGVILNLMADVLETVEVPTDCACQKLLIKRPDIYRAAITTEA